MNGINHIARDCMKLIIIKMNREISPEAYYIALMDLDRKYPVSHREFPLSKETLAYYRERELQPVNFYESAQMYIRHKERVDKD